MLTKHASRVCTFFAVDFGPQFGTRLANAAEEIFTQFAPEKWHVQMPASYSFLWPSERRLMILNFQRIAWQTLGLSAWQDKLDERAAIIKTALRIVGIEEFKRIGFKVTAFLPLEMSHLELSQLMFGSFLAAAEELADVCGEPKDPLVHLQGEKDNMQYALVLSAMTTQQASDQFLQTVNLAYFRESKFLDTSVKDFHDRIAENDCFYVDLDLFRRDVPANTLDTFLKRSLANSEELTTACVQRLRSQPIKIGK